MYVYFGEKIDVGHSSYLKGLSDYRNKSVIIFNENVILYEISLLPHSLFVTLSLPFLSTRLWYDFRECGTQKTSFFGFTRSNSCKFSEARYSKIHRDT